jgi:hypothetical protein
MVIAPDDVRTANAEIANIMKLLDPAQLK